MPCLVQMLTQNHFILYGWSDDCRSISLEAIFEILKKTFRLPLGAPFSITQSGFVEPQSPRSLSIPSGFIHPLRLAMASVSVLAASLGVASHLGYFIHGEHHMESPRIFSAFVLGPFAFFLWQFSIAGYGVREASKVTAIASFSYFTALVVSITVYRVFFHPLRHFPGPFSARLTKLTHVARLLPRSDNFVQAHQLHQKYGDIVRVGPNELTIINPDAVGLIHGSSSKCIKSNWYDAVGGENPSIQLTRDRITHDKRRKIWDQAFSMKGKSKSKYSVPSLIRTQLCETMTTVFVSMLQNSLRSWTISKDSPSMQPNGSISTPPMLWAILHLANPLTCWKAGRLILCLNFLLGVCGPLVSFRQFHGFSLFS